MCNNKLRVAIAAILAMGVNTTVHAAAGEFKFRLENNSSYETGPITYATELFPTNAALPTTQDYVISWGVSKDYEEDVTLTISLDNGATWGRDVGRSDLDYNNVSGGGEPAINPVGGGEADGNEVVFLLLKDQNTNTNLEKDDIINFQFTIKDPDEILAKTGGPIKVSVKAEKSSSEVALPTPDPLSIAKSERGVQASVRRPSPSKNVAVDVTEQNKKFVVEGTSGLLCADIAWFSLGTAVGIKDLGGDSFDLADVQSASGSIELTENGIFNASLNTDGNLDPEKVFIAFDCHDGEFDEDKGDILAVSTSLTDTSAEWELSKTQITSDTVDEGLSTVETHCIRTCVDGENLIITHDSPPTGVLKLNFGGNPAVYSANFVHIQSNGSVCNLKNIPNGSALDIGFVRITNKSTKREATTVTGTLRDESGAVISGFRDVDLLQFMPTPLTSLPARNTAVIPVSNIHNFIAASSTPPPTPAPQLWKGRAVLTVTSDLPDGEMEVFGLVRRPDEQGGGPLMNVSTGASGNECNF